MPHRSISPRAAAASRAPARRARVAASRCGLLLLLLLVSATAAAESRSISAVRRSGAVTIDGVLDEPAWEASPVGDGFWQRAPREGNAPTHDTEFRVLYDDAALYLGVHLHDSDPAQIVGLVTRRDQASSSDWLEVSIDSYRDRRTSFVFALNPAGVQRDWIIFDDVSQDFGWDAIWHGAARVTSDGWTAELRIPFSELRFATAEQLIWGIQVRRVVARTNEDTVWSPWPQTNPYAVRHYGTVHGLSDVQPPRRLAFLPYSVASLGFVEGGSDSPLRDDVEPNWQIGLDVKYGLGSNFTLAGTVNPDFGQVEADPSEVNLTASETFLSEQRPFFLEGTEVFQFGLGQSDSATEELFYSRRIGGAPRGDSGVGEYRSVPRNTRIHGAAKISGKTASGWTVGVLEAVTAEEHAEVIDGDTRRREVVEPLTNYAVVRVKRDANEGRTVVGAAATSVHRALGGTGLASEMHDYAYTGGAQLDHRFWDATWSANMRVSGSYVHGSELAITETQRANQRYYQRPDADYLDYDETRRSLTGGAAIWSISKDTGGHIRFGVGGDMRSPGLEINDIGFQQFADNINKWVWLQYHDEEVSSAILDYELNTVLWSDFDWGLGYKGSVADFNGRVTLPSYWRGSGGVQIHALRWLPGQLRGGPSMRGDTVYQSWFELISDERRAVAGTLRGWIDGTPATDSWSVRVAPGVRVLARSNLELSLEPTIWVRAVDDQYVDQLTEPGGTTDYIAARLQQTTLSTVLRLNYAFLPTLTLQVYAEPFLSSGSFSEYKRAADPTARRYRDRYQRFSGDQIDRIRGRYDIDRDGDGAVDYSFDVQDFDFRQLRSSVVLRWQYRPGSTLFAVWSHERFDEAREGQFKLSDELGALAAAAGEHVFLLKLNWLLNV